MRRTSGPWRARAGAAERVPTRPIVLVALVAAELWFWEALELLRKYLVRSAARRPRSSSAPGPRRRARCAPRPSPPTAAAPIVCWQLTAVIVVVGETDLTKILFGQVVSFSSAMLVGVFWPYTDRLCGRVQLLCLTQLTFPYMAAVYFVDGSGASDHWGAALIILHGLSFVALAVALVRAVDGSVRDVQGAVHSRRTGQLFELPPRPPNIEWHLFLSRCVPAASNRMRARIRCHRMP